MKKFLLMMLVMIASIIYANAYTNNFNEVNDDIKIINTDINKDINFNTVCIGLPSTLYICESDSFDINIETLENDDIYDHLKYEVHDSILKIWIDYLIPNDITKLDSKNIKITIMSPIDKDNIQIKTFNDLHVLDKNFKKNKTVNHENN